jgi:hypothetical protein
VGLCLCLGDRVAAVLGDPGKPYLNPSLCHIKDNPPETRNHQAQCLSPCLQVHLQHASQWLPSARSKVSIHQNPLLHPSQLTSKKKQHLPPSLRAMLAACFTCGSRPHHLPAYVTMVINTVPAPMPMSNCL